MTITLERPDPSAPRHPHLPVVPAEGSAACLICGADGWCSPTRVVRDGDTVRRLWRDSTCDAEYTTEYVPPPCPDALPWCVEHDVDPDGFHWHHGHTEFIRADRNGTVPERDIDTLDVRAVLVNNVDGTPDPVIWIAELYQKPGVCLAEGMGISPGRAREIAALLVRLADDLDGSVSR